MFIHLIIPSFQLYKAFKSGISTSSSDGLSNETRPNIPPTTESKTTSVLLFPGQGAQFVGMAKKLIDLKEVKRMFESASEILRTDLLRTCLDGPVSKLNQTIHCQPAIYVTSLGAALKLRHDNQQAVDNCIATAGFSVGEVTALAFAGAMTFEEGLHVVRVRAQAMQKACDSQPASAMASVFVEHDSHLSLAIQAAIEHCKSEHGLTDPCCRIANYLYADCKVVAGVKQAIDFIESHTSHFNLRRVKRIAVSGAFHTPLMQSAVRPLANALGKLPNLKSPAIPVVSAVDIQPYTSPESIRHKIPKQVVSPVKWEQVMHYIYDQPPDDNYPLTFELGPGRQLGAMLRAVNRKAFESYSAVDV